MPLVAIRSSPLPLTLAWALASLAPLACTDGPVTQTDASSGTTGTYVPPMPTTVETYNITMPPEDTTGVVFLLEPDAGPRYTCDLFEQDCPPGEKCTVWAHDGGGNWNASKCVPVVREPAKVGERCRMEMSPTSGIDDCDFGTMCWDVDPETLEGSCAPFCVGDPSGPYCEDRDRFCPISADGAIALCLLICDPLADGCGGGRVCIPNSDHWMCATDASGDLGGFGDPCSFINSCDPGLICIGDWALPPGAECQGSNGCCTEVCDLTDPLGDLQCAGAAEGQHCLPWYAEGEAPAGLEHVGACAVPP